MAVRTDILCQILLKPLHAFFILNLGKSVLHRIHGRIIRKIHLRRFQRIWVDIMNMMLFHLTMIDNLFFCRSQITERNIRSDTHGADNILHQ